MMFNMKCPHASYSDGNEGDNPEFYCALKKEVNVFCKGCPKKDELGLNKLCDKCGHLNLTCIGDNVYPDGTCPSFFDPNQMQRDFGDPDDMDFGSPEDYMDGPDMSLDSIERNYGCVQEYQRCQSERSHGPIKRLEDLVHQLMEQYKHLDTASVQDCEMMNCPHLLHQGDGFSNYSFCRHHGDCPVGADKIKFRHNGEFKQGPWNLKEEIEYFNDYKAKYPGAFEFMVEIQRGIKDVRLEGAEIIKDHPVNEIYWVANWYLRATQPEVKIFYTKLHPIFQYSCGGERLGYREEQCVDTFHLAVPANGRIPSDQINYDGKVLHDLWKPREDEPEYYDARLRFDHCIIHGDNRY